MPRNLEVKASIPSVSWARALADQCGAVFQGVLLQEDTYFQAHRGRLKLREINGSEAELIFYERQETSAERWSHYTKIPVTQSAELKATLASAMGILAVVRKRRLLYLHDGARVHLDEVEGLGAFLEFEVPAANEEGATRHMTLLRGLFRVTDDTIFTSSYSDLILAKTERAGP